MKPARPHSGDRNRDCQDAMNDRMFSLMNQATKAGWSESEVALAVHELARAWLRWRHDQRVAEEQIEAVRRRQ